jgi:ketol-acid reductoisomerase
VYENLSGADKAKFEQAYSAAYQPAKDVLAEIYDEVRSGNEIRSVIMHGDRFDRFPIGKIDGTLTWQVGEKVSQPLVSNYASSARLRFTLPRPPALRFTGTFFGFDVRWWQVRAKRVESEIPLNPVTAGIYIATMMAQVRHGPARSMGQRCWMVGMHDAPVVARVRRPKDACTAR